MLPADNLTSVMQTQKAHLVGAHHLRRGCDPPHTQPSGEESLQAGWELACGRASAWGEKRMGKDKEGTTRIIDKQPKVRFPASGREKQETT